MDHKYNTLTVEYTVTQWYKNIKNQPIQSMGLSFPRLGTTNQRKQNETLSLVPLSILTVIGKVNFFFFSRRRLIGLWVWLFGLINWVDKLFGLTNSDCWCCLLKSNGPNSISKDALRDEDCPWPYKPITHSNYFQCGIIISNTPPQTQARRCWILLSHIGNSWSE